MESDEPGSHGSRSVSPELWERLKPLIYSKIGRKKPLMTAAALAKAMGLKSQTPITQWKKGGRPSESNLKKALTVLGYDIAIVAPELAHIITGRDPYDDALLRLVYEDPAKATVLVECALALKNSANMSADEELTVSKAVEEIRFSAAQRFSREVRLLTGRPEA